MLLTSARQVERMVWSPGHAVLRSRGGKGDPPHKRQHDINRQYVHRICSLPGPILRTSRILTYLILSIVLGGTYYHHPHFTDEESEGGRG